MDRHTSWWIGHFDPNDDDDFGSRGSVGLPNRKSDEVTASLIKNRHKNSSSPLPLIDPSATQEALRIAGLK